MKTIIKNTPFHPFFSNHVQYFVNDVENKVKQAKSIVSPNTNIKETPTHFCIQIAAPGLEKSDFDVTVLEKTLEVKVEKDVSEKFQWIRKEFEFTHFKKAFSLPKNIDKKRIEVKYKAGILEIDLYKTEKIEEPKKLLVN
jgi:HSP20 family protein